ncbi:hypothetical protein [Sphingobium sp. MK2]|uniref:hypothetical protein n=1 Tax=Sphingobium sp. MK2 TaxID=3116540 RepID=UPI0032E367C5
MTTTTLRPTLTGNLINWRKQKRLAKKAGSLKAVKAIIRRDKGDYPGVARIGNWI